MERGNEGLSPEIAHNGLVNAVGYGLSGETNNYKYIPFITFLMEGLL